MDTLSWLGFFGLVISGFILLYGIRRAKAYAAAEQAPASRLPKHETTQTAASSLAGDWSYLEALKTGDPDKIAKARLPELLTPELLFQGLSELQGQPSSLDVFIERIRRQFAMYQYRKLTRSWVQYIEHMGMSQEAFWRQVTERFLVPLQQQKGARALEADIAEQDLRAAQARHAQEALDGSKPEPEKPPTEDELIAQWFRDAQEEVARLKTKGFDDKDYEVQSVWTKYQVKVRDLRSG